MGKPKAPLLNRDRKQIAEQGQLYSHSIVRLPGAYTMITIGRDQVTREGSHRVLTQEASQVLSCDFFTTLGSRLLCRRDLQQVPLQSVFDCQALCASP